MSDLVTIYINGTPTRVTAGTIVSAALLNASVPARISVSGEPRSALCGMGICMECRAVVDGVPQQRTCQLLCRHGMRIETQP